MLLHMKASAVGSGDTYLGVCVGHCVTKEAAMVPSLAHQVVCEEDILHTGVDISCVTVDQLVARIRRICPGVLLKSDEHVFVPQFRCSSYLDVLWVV